MGSVAIIIYFIVITGFLLISGMNAVYTRNISVGLDAKRGFVNLTGWNEGSSANVELNGEWEFYWNKF